MTLVMHGQGRVESTGDQIPYVATYLVDDGSVAWRARLDVGGAQLVVSACEDLSRDDKRETKDIVAAAIDRMIASLHRRRH